jgi:hypothetical protein
MESKDSSNPLSPPFVPIEPHERPPSAYVGDIEASDFVEVVGNALRDIAWKLG